MHFLNPRSQSCSMPASWILPASRTTFDDKLISLINWSSGFRSRASKSVILNCLTISTCNAAKLPDQAINGSLLVTFERIPTLTFHHDHRFYTDNETTNCSWQLTTNGNSHGCCWLSASRYSIGWQLVRPRCNRPPLDIWKKLATTQSQIRSAVPGGIQPWTKGATPVKYRWYGACEPNFVLVKNRAEIHFRHEKTLCWLLAVKWHSPAACVQFSLVESRFISASDTHVGMLLDNQCRFCSVSSRKAGLPEPSGLIEMRSATVKESSRDYKSGHPVLVAKNMETHCRPQPHHIRRFLTPKCRNCSPTRCRWRTDRW